MYHFKQNNPVGGVVILTGSITSFVPAHEGMYVYAASKYAVRSSVFLAN
jgi:short-subunit dehydrogenase